MFLFFIFYLFIFLKLVGKLPRLTFCLLWQVNFLVGLTMQQIKLTKGLESKLYRWAGYFRLDFCKSFKVAQVCESRLQHTCWFQNLLRPWSKHWYPCLGCLGIGQKVSIQKKKEKCQPLVLRRCHIVGFHFELVNFNFKCNYLEQKTKDIL